MIFGYALAVCTTPAVFGLQIQGVPWQGPKDVTESVATIVAREQNSVPRTGEAKADAEHDRISLGGKPGDQPFEFGLSQTVGTSFVGVSYSDTAGFVPPNSQGAVGPSQILFVMNGRIRTFNKSTGTKDNALDTTTNSFFSTGLNTTVATSDSRVLYDRLSQRFFVTMITTGVSPNSILIAVSKGSTITSNSSFTFWSFAQDFPDSCSSNPTTCLDAGKFADYPSSGVDNSALYIGVNIFNAVSGQPTTYFDSSVFVINKQSLLTGTPPTPYVTVFRAVASNSTSGPFAPQGVSNMDPLSTVGYFAGIDSRSPNVLRFLQISNPGGNGTTQNPGVPSSTLLASLVKAFNPPLTVPAQGSTPPLDAIDTTTSTGSRLGATQIFVMPDGSEKLWTAQTIRVNSAGAACSIGSCNRDGVRFYEVDFTGASSSMPPTLTQSATLYDSSTGSTPNSFWVPSVATNGQGHTILASSYAGAAAYAGIAIGGRLYTDSTNTLNSTPVFIPANAAYNVITTGPIVTLGAITGGSGYTNGTYNGVVLSGGSGTGATANITVSTNTVTAVVLVSGGTGYKVNDTLSAATSSIGGGSGSGFSVPVASIPPQRWGDLSSTVIDPNDNQTFWTFQQITNASNAWSVEAVQVLAPPPATPSSVSPATVNASSIVNIVVTGTSSNGSGFYDPGPGFQNRLSATVSGNGDVTVNSVIYTDSTHITLNITVAANAAQTARTITVTNPDGQCVGPAGTNCVVTSATTILTIGPAVGITFSPSTLPAAVVNTFYSQTITPLGGTGQYTFSVTSGAVPKGTVLVPTPPPTPPATAAPAATLTGTPTTSGTANFTVQAQDSNGNFATISYSLSVQTLLTPSVSVSITSISYDPTPLPSYAAGKWTANTTLTNHGSSIAGTSNLYFVVTTLVKYFGDPSKPDVLWTADGSPGGVGAHQTVNLGGVAFGTGQSIPVSFTVAVGTANTFNLGLDLYMVPQGSAMTVLSDPTKARGVMRRADAAISGLDGNGGTPSPDTQQPGVFLGRFALIATQVTNPTVSPSPDLTLSGPFSNAGIITGPGAHSRPAVAVDPILPNRMAIASNDYLSGLVRISTSQDGGATWYNTTLGSTVDGVQFFVAKNPTMAFDSFGRLSVVYNVANLQDSANAIVISESTDLVNFNPPSTITSHLDSDQIVDSRPVIAINSDIGRVVAWDRLSATTSTYSIMAARSPEGGLFDPPVTVVDSALVSTPALALSRNTVYLGWDDWGFNSSAPYTTGGRLMIAVSSDPQSLDFGTPSEIITTSIGFGQRIPAMPDAGVGPGLALAADPKNDAHIFAVFADAGNGPNLNVRLGRSKDRGNRWDFVQVNDNTVGADHFDPSIALDATGNVNVAFYDTQSSSFSQTADVFLARSLAHGSSFDIQRVTTALINDSTTNPLRDTTADLGDRIAITTTDSDVLIAWTDTRDGSEGIFASSVFDRSKQFITGSGIIKFPTGSYRFSQPVAGVAEFGFEAGYRKNRLVPDGSVDLRFQVGKTRFVFTSTFFESLIVSGTTAELHGAGRINGAGDYLFLLTISEDQISGTSIGKVRIQVTDKATGAVVYDNLPGAPEAVLPSITAGRLQVRDR